MAASFWLIDWLMVVDWSSRSVDWLIDWLIVRLTDSIDWLIDYSVLFCLTVGRAAKGTPPRPHCTASITRKCHQQSGIGSGSSFTGQWPPARWHRGARWSAGPWTEKYVLLDLFFGIFFSSFCVILWTENFTLFAAYEDTLGQLEHWKTEQSVRIKAKDQQIAQLTKELQLAQRHLSQFTTNPTAQFKLISDLYTAFVAAEDKIAAFEEKESALEEQQRSGIEARGFFFQPSWTVKISSHSVSFFLQTIKELQDQLIGVRGSAKEYEEALKLAERDLARLKKVRKMIKIFFIPS